MKVVNKYINNINLTILKCKKLEFLFLAHEICKSLI